MACCGVCGVCLLLPCLAADRLGQLSKQLVMPRCVCRQTLTSCSHAPTDACSLVLLLPAFTAADPLPAVQLGALPHLREFELTLLQQAQPVPLPPSWGDPAAWPTLRFLKLVTMVALPLPASWANGFPALQELTLRSNVDQLSGPAAADTGPSGHSTQAPQSGALPQAPFSHSLPAEWARGFPRLEKLMLQYLGLSGTFPGAWQARGSFPQLRDM